MSPTDVAFPVIFTYLGWGTCNKHTYPVLYVYIHVYHYTNLTVVCESVSP